MNDIEVGRPASGRTDARATAADVRDACPGDIDLTGVDAVHWAETRERVAILRAWCGTSRHPRSEAVAAAARMGVTVSHFYRLVAVWKKHREARLVSGHASRRGDQRETQTKASDARAIMSRIIDESGPEARFTDVRAQIRGECAAAGVVPPSSGLVHKAMMRARQSPPATTVDTVHDIAVAIVDCLLPVTATNGTVTVPSLILAVERPSGIIVGHRLVTDGDAVEAARPLLARIADQHDERIIVAAPLAGVLGKGACEAGREKTVIGAAHTRDGRIEVVRRSALLTTMLGGHIDNIPIRHRSHAARSAGPWRPLSTVDAVAAVDLAVAAHNAARRG